MTTYEVKLKKIGEMTTLPDSQRLFGFLVNNSKKYCSENEISAFVKRVRERKGKCMVSSVAPTGYYPTPKEFIMEKLKHKLGENLEEIKELEEKQIKLKKEIELIIQKNSSKEDKEKLKTIKKNFNNLSNKINNLSTKNIYETIKSMDFIKKNQLRKLLKFGESEEKINVENLKKFDYIKKSQIFIQKFRLESQIKELPGMPNVAYSLPILSFTNQAGDDQKKFSFFVKVEKDSCIAKSLEKMKKELDSYEIPCFLGGKGSSGYNEHLIHCIEKLDESKDRKQHAVVNTIYLNIGVLLPDFDKIDAEKSVIDIYTSDRKPFEIENEISKVISFVTAGSVIKAKEDKTELYEVGKSIDNSKYNPLYKKNAIIFGNSYLIKLEV